MPVTRSISVRNFRENLSKFLTESQEKGVHFVIMKHSVPVAHVTPACKSDSYEDLTKDIARARKEVKQGKIFSSDEVRHILGL